LSICYPVERGADGMARALEDLCREAADVVRHGNNIIILSDRSMDADHIAIPALRPFPPCSPPLPFIIT